MNHGKRFRSWRWIICGGIFVLVVINFVDRLSFSVAAPAITHDLQFSNANVASIAIAFTLAYYPGMILWGKLIDSFGSRTGTSIAVVWWSVAEVLTGGARSVATFSASRFLLGLGEAGIGPSAVKVASEWFGAKERATAIGFYTSGSTVAAVVGTPLIAVAVVHAGWQWTFVLAGAIGLLWVFAWLALYQSPARHPYVSEEEIELIQTDIAEEEARSPVAQNNKAMGWFEIFRYKQMWALVLARLFAEPLALSVSTFMPKYMVEQRRFQMISMGLISVIPAAFGTAGLFVGGLLAGHMLRGGTSLSLVRERLLVLGLLLQMAVVPAVLNPNERILVSLLSLGSFGSGVWSANINALAVDISPKHLVASVLGISAFGGGIAASIYLKVAGALADSAKSLTPVFLAAGVMPIASIFALVGLLGGVKGLRVGTRAA